MLDEIKRFLANSSLAVTTRGLYLYHLNRLSDWMDLQQISARSLKAEQLRTYLDQQAWGSSSKNLALCAARAFWKWKYGSRHQVCGVRIKREDSGPQRTLSKKQIEQLISSFDTSRPKGIRDLALVMLMLDTGVRASELCRLTLDYLDMEEQTIQVKIKGGAWEPGAFFEYTTSCLEAWLAIRHQVAKAGVETVFVSIGGDTQGHPLTRDGLRAIFRKLGKKAGIGDFSPHDLRRSFTTLALKAGAPTRTVELGGRWKDIGMVERYSRALRVKAMHKYSPANYVMGVRPTLREED
jgi:site-specific recombinase XerD